MPSFTLHPFIEAENRITALFKDFQRYIWSIYFLTVFDRLKRLETVGFDVLNAIDGVVELIYKSAVDNAVKKMWDRFIWVNEKMLFLYSDTEEQMFDGLLSHHYFIQSALLIVACS